MMAPVVVLDLDEVLLDFGSAWQQCAERTLCRPVQAITDDYALENRFGLSLREVSKVWDVFHKENYWERVSLYENAWDLVESLEGMGCSLWAVTNVDSRHLNARVVSLQGMIPSGRIVTLGQEATAMDRLRVLRDLRAIAFLDDRPDNVNAAVGHVPNPVLIDRGYTDMPEPLAGVSVIDDLQDFAEVLLPLLEFA